MSPSIVALFLGRLRMKCDEAIDAYAEFSSALEAVPTSIPQERRENSQQLAEAFGQSVRFKERDPNVPMLERNNADGCKTRVSFLLIDRYLT
jgi:hypothetical protein